MKKNDVLSLCGALALTVCAGLIGTYFSAPAIPTWYAALAKSPLNPPGWVFGPVWGVLYLLMGVSLHLVWRNGLKREGVKAAVEFFFLQLFLNALWSIFFFGMQNVLLAYMENVLLWFAVLATISAFYRVSRPAAWLLVPYICWVSFAGYLNFEVWNLMDTPKQQSGIVYCSMDAKLCPDGSAVGRIGPQCQFAPCPGQR
jgi:tryptophan-rich sensory protein